MHTKSCISIATLFLEMDNIHLIKDPGMIPFTLHNKYKWKSIIPLWSNKHYEFKNKYFDDIDTPILKSSNFRTIKRLRMAKWILKNGVDIDVLHLYFYERWTWIYIWIYKLKNPQGLVYVHCDTDGEILINYELPKSRIKRFIITKILLKDKNIYDVLWGIQNSKNCEILKRKWPFYNIKYIPNGVYWRKNCQTPFKKRKNVILTVARNGATPKKTEILLEGFAKVANDYPQYNLQLVGSVEESFQSYIDNYFQRFPNLKKRIIFSGPILNREELQKVYCGAKIFCLTSAYESFGLVTIEAMSCGCFIIESDIPSNIDITQDGKFGTLFKSGDIDDFSKKLSESLSDEQHMSQIALEGKKYADMRFTWDICLLPVVQWVNEKRKEKM